MSRILLFNVPWVSPRHAPLGLGIVAALLRKDGMSVDCRYVNIEFFLALVDRVGERAAEFAYTEAELSEVVLGSLLGDDSARSDSERSARAALLGERGYKQTLWTAVREEFRAYTAKLLDGIAWQEVSACGFSLSIRQTLAALVLATAIKQRAPHVAIVFGGSTVEDPMGLALFRALPVIDYLARGECDTSIVPLFRAAIAGDPTQLAAAPNVAFRHHGEVVVTPSQLIPMAEAVSPDYDDFERAFSAFQARFHVRANYYLEASRGCWWGQKHHCTFCGIHTSSIQYREKSTEQIVSEIRSLLLRHRTLRFVFADTILSMTHIKTLLPRLERLRDDCCFEFFADVKSNLRKEEVYALARAGCTGAQLGIESLSDRLLRLMEKGNTALQQIQALKWFVEAGIEPFYALLTHVPGESPADYEEILGHLKSIVHLTPPRAIVPIEINRYAPYFRSWQALGFARPVPARSYQYLFPSGSVDLDEFAYHFEGVHASTQSAELEQARSEVANFLHTSWTPRYAEESLTYRPGFGFVELRRRGARNEQRLLEGAAAEIYLACDRVQRVDWLCERFASALRPPALEALLTELCDAGYMTRARDGAHVLALATRSLVKRPYLPTEPAREEVSARRRQGLVVLGPRGGSQ